MKRRAKPKKLKDKAKICTVYLVKKDIEFIKVLTDNGYFLSRSEAVRVAVHEFVKSLMALQEKLKDFKPLENPLEKIDMGHMKIINTPYTYNKYEPNG